MADREPRMSGPTLKVLKFLLHAPREARSGAEIGRETGIGSGTLYPMLARLEEASWLSSAWEDGDPTVLGRPRKRLYQLTGLGQRRASENLAELHVPEGALIWSS